MNTEEARNKLEALFKRILEPYISDPGTRGDAAWDALSTVRHNEVLVLNALGRDET